MAVFNRRKSHTFTVDGYDDKNNIIYEFYGCYHHGCTCRSTSDRATCRESTSKRETPLQKTLIRENILVYFCDN